MLQDCWFQLSPCLETSNRIVHSGIPLWAEGDHVHHTQDAYRELAEVIMEGDYSGGSAEGASASGCSEDLGGKRRGLSLSLLAWLCSSLSVENPMGHCSWPIGC
jgi:hypothetical protein